MLDSSKLRFSGLNSRFSGLNSRLSRRFSGVGSAVVPNTVPCLRGYQNMRVQSRSTGSFNKSSVSYGLPQEADVVIIGGGITGSALLYELAEFTDLDKIVLLERRNEFAKVASRPNNNSQTIHCGDIETNYTPEKAASVLRLANMLRNFATKLPPHMRDKAVAKMQKMAIGVGEIECDTMEKRFHAFKPYFPKLELLDIGQIAKFEPAVAYSNPTTKTFRKEPVVANFTGNDHSAVNYCYLAQSFINLAEAQHGKRQIRALTDCTMYDIQPADNGYIVFTTRGNIKAKFVVVSACGHSLLAAHRLGYARHFSCLPVAGSFYFGPRILNGKVYTVQNPLLPFAAIHGDPDIIADGKTRFGPTALPLPLLERYRWKTLIDFVEVLKPNLSLIKVYYDLFAEPDIRNYVLRNFLFEIPYLNRRLFTKDIQKIVPSIKLQDVHYAHGFGAVRPQIVDKKSRRLLLGEGKINPDDAPIVFNVTPSPGGTTCLGNAETDMRKIVRWLGCSLDEKKFSSALLQGDYPIA